MAPGVVHSINTSNGGVPKLSQPECRVTAQGLHGDWQNDRVDHGGPDRAVSLYSLELIQALRAEGHPVAAGSMGENLTLSGIEWQAMVPGAELEIGEVALALTSFAAPCKNIAGSFCDGAFVRVAQKKHPGWSRLYARVLREGLVRVGDRVSVRRK